MTVPVPDQLEYISDANGVTKDFPYPKRFLQKDEIVVALRNADGVETPQLLNTHYTIAGSSWPNGGTISFINAPKAPNKIVRYRMTQIKQTVGLANNQRNDAPSVETQLDRLTMGNQDTRTLADRALKFPAGATGQNVQPVPLPERGKAIVGNSDGTGYINAPVGEGDIAVAVEEANAARDQAVSAAATFAMTTVSDIPALKALDTTKFNTAMVKALGRDGMFVFQAGDFTARVAADTLNGVIVKANAIAASLGAWVRNRYYNYDVQQFGSPASLSSAVSAIEAIGGGVLRVPGGVTAGILPPNYGRTVVEYDGPSTLINFSNADSHGSAKRVWRSQHGATHMGETQSTFHIESRVNGSGANGPQQADVSVSLSHIKENFLTSTVPGELDGAYIVLQQGGPVPTSRSASSDHAGILIDTSNFGNCGHGFAIEAATRNYDKSGNLIVQVQTQMGGVETNWLAFNSDGSLNGNPLGVRYAYGFLASVETGTGDVAYLVEGSARWESAFRVNAREESAVFDIRNTGEFWQGSSTNRVKYKNNAGAINLTSSNDSVFASFSAASGVIAGNFSAANALRMQGSVSGSPTKLSSTGIDANIDIQIVPKGSGAVNLLTDTGAVFASFSTASGIIAGNFNTANALRMQGAATGSPTKISSVGTDANIDIQIAPKGTGSVNLLTDLGKAFASFSAASGIIAGDFNTANALRMMGGALSTYTRLEAVGADPNINLQILGKGAGYVMVGRGTNLIGFYGGNGVARQTGVAVTAAAIHAALVNLNLITA